MSKDDIDSLNMEDLTDDYLQNLIDKTDNLEPGLSKDTLLVATNSYDDIAAFLKPVSVKADVSKSNNIKISIHNQSETNKESEILLTPTKVELNATPDTVFKELNNLSVSELPELKPVITQPLWQTEEWRSFKKHVFIMSKTGKPIYTRYGEEDGQSDLFGAICAFSMFLEHTSQSPHESNHPDGQCDVIRSLVAGKHKFVFLTKDNLILVMAAETEEFSQNLLLQVTYLYHQIICMLSLERLKNVFNDFPNYDLRRLLTGLDKFNENLLVSMDQDICYSVGAIRCLSIEPIIRDSVSQVIASNVKIKNLVFAFLLNEDRMISAVRLKQYHLHPIDMHLLCNTINSSESLKQVESWLPICLPHFNINGYLYGHISYLDLENKVCLILLTVDRECFYELSECKKKISEKLVKNGNLKSIIESIAIHNYPVSITGVPNVLHFVYKVKSSGQMTEPMHTGIYSIDENKKRLFLLYQTVIHRMNYSCRKIKIYYHTGCKESILGWHASGFEMYAVFSPLVSKQTAIISVNKLIRWIKKEEKRLFIMISHCI